MIDGPRSYPIFSKLPGRMSPIFTSTVVAHTRAASSDGYIDIFLHDVSRHLEKQLGEEFLCISNSLKSMGDLKWYFKIQPTGPNFVVKLQVMALKKYGFEPLSSTHHIEIKQPLGVV